MVTCLIRFQRALRTLVEVPVWPIPIPRLRVEFRVQLFWPHSTQPRSSPSSRRR
uniref:Uncharacterized protein n=1 Tax=Oryza brachyantha TaxID=4533 RepID=J3LC69_ORYBR